MAKVLGRRSMILGLAALGIALGSVAHATTVLRLPIETLVRTSTWVVHGTVREVDDQAGVQQGGYRTRYTVDVAEVVKGGGPTPGSLVFSVPGGRAGERVMAVAGMPRLAAGDEVVLLLERTGNGGLAFAGFGQGVFFVRRDTTGFARVERSLGGGHYVGRAGASIAQLDAGLPNDLSALLASLRATVMAGEQPVPVQGPGEVRP